MVNKITTYTLSWCPHCNALKDYLKSEKLDFVNIDVENDEKAAEEIIEKTGQSGFPIVDIDGIIIIGFNKDKIKECIQK